MYKVSVNNIWGRIIYFVLGCLPLICSLSAIAFFHWDFKLSIPIWIYLSCCVFFLLIFIRFCCLDWDFYIVKGLRFQFEKLNLHKNVSIDSKFEIKTVFLATYYLNVFLIKFDNGEKFYFRYNKYQMGILFYQDVINKIYSIIEDNI